MADDQKQPVQPANPQSEPPKKPAAESQGAGLVGSRSEATTQAGSSRPQADSPPAREVSATDLLSLWGKPAEPTRSIPPAGPSKFPPKPLEPKPQPVAPKPTQAISPLQPKPVPKPTPAVSLPQPKPTPKPTVSFEPAPTPPRPAPAPRLEPKPEPLPPPKPKREESRGAGLVGSRSEATTQAVSSRPQADRPPAQVYEGEVLSEPKKSTASRAVPHMAAPPPTPNEPEPELLQEKEGFGAQVDEFLAELNLSRKHIFYGLGCIVLLVVLVWGGLVGYRYYKNRKTSEAPPPPPSAEISKEQTGIPVSTEVGQPVVVTKEMVGETGIDSTIAVGQTETIKTEIAYYIMTFRRLQNAYETNIDNLLNQSTDRRAKLRSHLAILKKLHTDGTQLLEQMKGQIEKIKQDYEPQRQLQETTDINFFEQLNALNAQTAEDILDKFTEASKQVVALRAKFKAFQKVAAFYEEALPKIAARIRDIELNEEALVSGIKVYDVKGSDLKLIVPIANGGVQDAERLSSPAFPLIPVNPADIKPSGRDFITQPGGGF